MFHFGFCLWLYGCWLITFAFTIAAFFKTTKAMFVVALITLIIIAPLPYQLRRTHLSQHPSICHCVWAYFVTYRSA